jgi:hypothetical protein
MRPGLILARLSDNVVEVLVVSKNLVKENKYLYCLYPVVYYYIVLLYNRQYNKLIMNKSVLLY